MVYFGKDDFENLSNKEKIVFWKEKGVEAVREAFEIIEDKSSHSDEDVLLVDRFFNQILEVCLNFASRNIVNALMDMSKEIARQDGNPSQAQKK